LKTVGAILFAFFVVWQPLTASPAKAAGCCGNPALACAVCPCEAKAPVSESPKPAAPIPSRTVSQEPVTLLLPTVSGEILLEKSSSPSVIPQAALSCAAGAVPLFRRDCALLI
jgi:hypothetical protein